MKHTCLTGARLGLIAAFSMSVALCQSPGQGAPKPPAFEVASVKPSRGGGGQLADERARGWGDVTGKVNLRHIPLLYVLTQIHGLKSYQISGPDWLGKDFFDILATVPEGTPKEQIPLMFDALLAERFKVKYHRETRVSPVYALVVAEGGLKLRKPALDKDPDDRITRSGEGEDRSISGAITGPYGKIKMTATATSLHNEFLSITLKGLADYLGNGMAGLPVVDRTGLSGSYAITLDISMRELRAANPNLSSDAADSGQGTLAAPDPGDSQIRPSLEKQGLKLVKDRAPIDFLIIDHIERTPTEN